MKPLTKKALQDIIDDIDSKFVYIINLPTPAAKENYVNKEIPLIFNQWRRLLQMSIENEE